VGVVSVQPRQLNEVAEFAGQVEAMRRVEVRSPVAGVIVAQPIREGAEVAVGDVLFRIDPTSYDATLRGAKARLTEAEARLRNATRTVERLRPLLADHAVAQRDVDDAETAETQARASVEDAQATVDRAAKDLSDATVRAEIAGRVGKANLLQGARVTGPADLLTTIDALDPVRVTFRPSNQQTLHWRRDPQAMAALRPGGSARIRIILPDGTLTPTEGKLDYVEPVIDPASGTQEFRARVPNPKRLLLPGQFVRVRLEGLVRDSAILVPQRAVQQQLGRQSVYLLGVGDTVVARDVKATAWVGDEWLIEEGLAPGDRVVVDGLQKVRPGGVAKPTPAQAEPSVDSTVAGGAS